MGLLLLIPGLIFLLNGVTWFEGENGVGEVLFWVGGVLLALQVIWLLFVVSKVKRTHARLRRDLFDRRGF